MTIFPQIIIIISAMRISFYILSKVEKLFVKENTRDLMVRDSKSLNVFRIIRNIICVSVAIELSCFQATSSGIEIKALGVLFVISGLTLRILSIIELGDQWSYNVVTFRNQKIVKTGIYYFFKHPAYLGNIYIVGLTLCFGAYYSAFFSGIAMIEFYRYRSVLEDRLLQCQ